MIDDYDGTNVILVWHYRALYRAQNVVYLVFVLAVHSAPVHRFEPLRHLGYFY